MRAQANAAMGIARITIKERDPGHQKVEELGKNEAQSLWSIEVLPLTSGYPGSPNRG